MTALVRTVLTQNAALKARIEAIAERSDTSIADFDRRLSLAEAKGGMAAAMGAAAAESAPSAAPASARTAKITSLTVQASAPADAAQQPARRYTVRAASPGLAMLAEVDRSGSDGAQLQIHVGDDVPGFGRVTGIAQRGAAWVVQTTHGTIQ